MAIKMEGDRPLHFPRNSTPVVQFSTRTRYRLRSVSPAGRGPGGRG